MGLPISWLSHLHKDSKERAELEQTIRASTSALDRLRNILIEKVQEVENQNEDFSIPAWAEKQAYTLGQVRAYLNVIKLLSFLDDK
jgi:hypothetical protein